MKTISEGQASAVRILREVPVMRLYANKVYTPAAQTDIRKTMAQFGLFGVKA